MRRKRLTIEEYSDDKPSTLESRDGYRFVCCQDDNHSVPSIGCDGSDCDNWIHTRVACMSEADVALHSIVGDEAFKFHCFRHMSGSERDSNLRRYYELTGVSFFESAASKSIVQNDTTNSKPPASKRPKRAPLATCEDNSHDDDDDIDMDGLPVPNCKRDDFLDLSISDGESQYFAAKLSEKPADNEDEAKTIEYTKWNGNAANHEYWRECEDATNETRKISIKKGTTNRKWNATQWNERPYINFIGRSTNNRFCVGQYAIADHTTFSKIFRYVGEWDMCTKWVKGKVTQYLARMNLDCDRLKELRFGTLPTYIPLLKAKANYPNVLMNSVLCDAFDNLNVGPVGAVGSRKKVPNSKAHQNESIKNRMMMCGQLSGDNEVGKRKTYALFGATAGFLSYKTVIARKQSLIESYKGESLKKLIDLSPKSCFTWTTKVIYDRAIFTGIEIALHHVLTNAKEYHVQIQNGLGPTIWKRTAHVFNTICFKENWSGRNAVIPFITPKVAKQTHQIITKQLWGDKNEEYYHVNDEVDTFMKANRDNLLDFRMDDVTHLAQQATSKKIKQLQKKVNKKNDLGATIDKLCGTVDKLCQQETKSDSKKPAPIESQDPDAPLFAILCEILCDPDEAKLKHARAVEAILYKADFLDKKCVVLQRLNQLKANRNITDSMRVQIIASMCSQIIE
eukprot:1061097_1